jgi:hypothetical protein
MTITVAKVFAFGKWEDFPIETALKRGSGRFRCPECNGRVRPHKASDDQPAHYEHHEMNPGCSLIPQTFDGVRREHRNPLR